MTKLSLIVDMVPIPTSSCLKAYSNVTSQSGNISDTHW